MRSRLFVIGDSHSLWNFAGAVGAHIWWLGAITMHRIGRDGVAACSPKRISRLGEDDILIFCFGEIDCRAHIVKISAQSDQPIEQVIDDVVARYFLSLRVATALTPARLGVSCVVPAGRTLDRATQSRLCFYMNAKLRRLATEAGIAFVDFYESCLDAAGDLISAEHDAVHLDPAASAPVVTLPPSFIQP